MADIFRTNPVMQGYDPLIARSLERRLDAANPAPGIREVLIGGKPNAQASAGDYKESRAPPAQKLILFIIFSTFFLLLCLYRAGPSAAKWPDTR
ncbi:hypothetical protein [Paraburkholderia sp. BL10I2N1]|uniref:hypothetical protein n=1 Tax=Paraburkholderia sp. BL10I2N1 TaxID=1938796 RepID=UPI00105ECA5E|nr:hypothetical protein [Paraburkholderia sp. BL10I2N1]TDN61296.1 hypothetical protein B0G77_4741 [Paraburkholderia sp. BL10I2N1]